MKSITQNGVRIVRALGLLAVAVFWLGLGAPLLAQEKSSTNAPASKAETSESLFAEPGEYSNSITFGFGHYFVNDNEAQFQRRLQMPAGSFGGIEELHFEKAVGKKGLFQFDGRGIFDNHDYSLRLDFSSPDIGYLRGGYTQFRTWYDGSGGYVPLANAWVVPYDDEMFIDRGRAWFEGGLTLPKWPVITMRYSYDFREGTKDSTIWGDYNLTQNPNNQVLRGITPTFRDIDEQRHTVDLDLNHTIGETKFGVGLRYEFSDVDNSLNILRRYGETNRVRTVTQSDSVDTDLFNTRAFLETRVHKNALFTVGGSYTRMDTDIGGSRIYGPDYYSPLNPIYANRQNNDEGFYDLGGGAQVDQYVGNVNLMLTPWQHVTIVPSLRIEHQDQVGIAMFTETRVTNSAAPFATEDILNNSNRDFTDVTGALEARYTGLTNWTFFVRGEWLGGQGRLEEREFDVADESVGSVQLGRDTELDRFVQKYVIGANWYATRKANFAAQYFYRSRNNEYDHELDSTAYDPPPAPVNTNNLYPAFIREHEFNTHDVNFRMTLRPVSGLTLVSRYDYTMTSYNTKGGIDSSGIALGEIESAEATAHIFSQSVSWAPLPQLYLQGSISYALQETESPASSLTGPAAGLVQDSENDYWTATVLAGYALTQRSDLQAQYSYYRADNYSPSNFAVGLPLGADYEQHGVTLTLISRLKKNIIWKLQYGFFTGDDGMSGGYNDYDAHLAYSSLQYLF